MKTIDPKPTINLLRSVLNLIVEYPEHLVIEPEFYSSSVEIYVTPHAKDMGKLVGTDAANFMALKTLLETIGTNNGYRIALAKIQTPMVGEKEAWRFPEKSSWPQASERVLKILADLLQAVFPHSPDAKIVPRENRDGSATIIEVFISGKERDDTFEVLSRAFATVLKSMGKSLGLQLHLDMIRVSPGSQPTQPASAAGRFAKEVK